MVDVGECCICGDPAQYIERTYVKDSPGTGWQTLDGVYKPRAYCCTDFFLMREALQEWEAIVYAAKQHFEDGDSVPDFTGE